MLKPGELTDAIEEAFKVVWAREKAPLPAGPPDDRRILFEAVARGVLGYLKAHQAELIDSLKVKEAGTAKDLDVESATLGIDTQ